jgi:hypothetical protein
MSFMFEVLRYLTYMYNTLWAFVDHIWSANDEDDGPVRRYFMSDEYVYSPPFRNIPIPENTIYVEEWAKNGAKRFRVLYSGEEITEYSDDPFAAVHCPWIWVGNKETEYDLTHTFSKFLFPGNVIRKELVDRLVDKQKLVYIDSKSFNEVEFPGSGVTIDVIHQS